MLTKVSNGINTVIPPFDPGLRSVALLRALIANNILPRVDICFADTPVQTIQLVHYSLLLIIFLEGAFISRATKSTP